MIARQRRRPAARCLGGLLALVGAVACRARPAPNAAAPDLAVDLAFMEPIVELAPGLGERRSHDVRLTGRLAARARLAIERVEDPALRVSVLPPEGERPAGLRLAFAADRPGVRTGQIAVATGLAQPARLTLLYALRVPGHIVVVPSNPYFNLRDPAARERRLRVTGRGPDFRIRAAQVVAGPFRAAVEADGADGGTGTIRVGVDAAALGNDQRGSRGFLGHLRILSNDPAQPETDVPLFAMGALPRANGVGPGTTSDAGRRDAGATR